MKHRTTGSIRTMLGHAGKLSRRAFLGLWASAGVVTVEQVARADASRPPRMGTERDLRWMDHALKGHDGTRDWLERDLLPRAALLAGIDETPCLGVVGYSSGVPLALEVFARKPHLFRTLGIAQPPFDEAGMRDLAQRLARGAAQSGFAGVYLQTSSRHRQRGGARALRHELTKRGVPTHIDELLGPGDDASWRSAGLLSVLAWHERQLQLVERPDPNAAPVQSNPRAKRSRRPLGT